MNELSEPLNLRLRMGFFDQKDHLSSTERKNISKNNSAHRVSVSNEDASKYKSNDFDSENAMHQRSASGQECRRNVFETFCSSAHCTLDDTSGSCDKNVFEIVIPTTPPGSPETRPAESSINLGSSSISTSCSSASAACSTDTDQQRIASSLSSESRKRKANEIFEKCSSSFNCGSKSDIGAENVQMNKHVDNASLVEPSDWLSHHQPKRSRNNNNDNTIRVSMKSGGDVTNQQNAVIPKSALKNSSSSVGTSTTAIKNSTDTQKHDRKKLQRAAKLKHKRHHKPGNSSTSFTEIYDIKERIGVGGGGVVYAGKQVYFY